MPQYWWRIGALKPRVEGIGGNGPPTVIPRLYLVYRFGNFEQVQYEFTIADHSWTAVTNDHTEISEPFSLSIDGAEAMQVGTALRAIGFSEKNFPAHPQAIYQESLTFDSYWNYLGQIPEGLPVVRFVLLAGAIPVSFAELGTNGVLFARKFFTTSEKAFTGGNVFSFYDGATKVAEIGHAGVIADELIEGLE